MGVGGSVDGMNGRDDGNWMKNKLSSLSHSPRSRRGSGISSILLCTCFVVVEVTLKSCGNGTEGIASSRATYSPYSVLILPINGF
jgi:hypothetical protein